MLIVLSSVLLYSYSKKSLGMTSIKLVYHYVDMFHEKFANISKLSISHWDTEKTAN